MNKTMRSVLAALALLVMLPALPALAAEAGTSVSVSVEAFEITSQTADFVLGVGEGQQLAVTVSEQVQTYQWEISTDGGATWGAAPGAANAPTYDITNAQENTPADMPYQYRVTATSASGESDSAVISVLVSNDYAYRTIMLRNGDVDASAYMHDKTRLIVTPIPDGAAAATQLEGALSPGCLPVMLRDVRLVNKDDQVVPFFGEAEVDFHVGAAYNGQTLNAYQLYNNQILTYSGTVTGGILTVTVSAPSSFMVEAAAAVNDLHKLTVTAGANGSVSPSGTLNVADGTDRTFTFLPDEGYAIGTVTVDGTPVTVTGNTYTLPDISADSAIAVSFVKVTPTDAMHTLTVSAGANGTVSPAGALEVRDGQAQTLYFYPNDGYELDKLLINGVEMNVLGDSFTLPAVTADATVTVSFRPAATQLPDVFKTVSVAAATNGSISPTGDNLVLYGGDLYLYFIPDSGYELDKVYIDNVETAVTGNAYHLVNVTADRDVRATFKSLPVLHTITATAGPNGSVSPSGAVQVADGVSQTFQFIPNAGYVVDTVTVDNVAVTAADSYTFSNVAADHTVSVTFKLGQAPPTTYHTITATSGANGSLSPSGTVQVADGGSQTFTFVPNSGYELDTLTVDGTVTPVTGSAYTFTNVRADHTISATFRLAPAPVYHTITANAGTHGSISPAGAVQVADGGSQTFYFIPQNGYEVSEIRIDGVKLAHSARSYTFVNVTAAHTVSVTFRLTDGAPKTGDRNEPLLWAGLCLASAALLCCCWLYIRKRREQE